MFFNISNDISSAAIATVSEHKDSLRVIPLTTDNTPFNYYTTINDRTSNNSLISAYINKHKTLNEIRNLIQRDIQTSSHFESEEIVETIPRTTPHSYSPIHPALTTPDNKNTPFRQTKLKFTVKPRVVPKCCHKDYQTKRPITRPRQINKQKHINKNNFANQNHDFLVNKNLSRPKAKPLYSTRNKFEE